MFTLKTCVLLEFKNPRNPQNDDAPNTNPVGRKPVIFTKSVPYEDPRFFVQ
jgi:hypothetical protein